MKFVSTNPFPFLMSEAGEASGGGSSEAVEAQSDESTDSESEEGSGESEQEAQLAAQKKKIKQLPLKFNGKEYTEDLPFEIDEEHKDWYVKQLQKAKLADYKANEYSQLEREIGAFIQELRANPKKALSNPAIGLDIKQFAAQILQEEIEQAQKSPEQLEKEAMQRELEEIKAQRQKEKEEFDARELQRLEEREYERYDSLMASALESSDLPKSPYVVKKMTEYMMLGLENGIDVQPADVIPLIREEIHREIQEMFQVMPAEVIEQIMGKNNLDKLRKKRVAGAKPVPLKAAVKDTAASKKEEKKEENPKTFRDFFGV